MSCPPEHTWALYVDAELADGERRDADAHLVGCRDCRARVLALREEGELLASALRGEGAPAAAPAESERGLAIGLPLSLAAAVAAGAVATALLERALPSGLAWLNPIRLAGAYEMLFDTFFVLRDRAPGLLELVAAVAATAAGATLAAAAAGALARRVGGAALLALAALWLAPPPAGAVTLLSDETVVIESSEVRSETLVVSAESVRIDGRLEGDLVVAAERLTITGELDGDLYCWARDVDVAGSVRGGILCGAERLRVDGDVAGDAYAFGESFSLGPQGQVGGDVVHAGRSTSVDGRVGRDLVFLGEELAVGGQVARDVQVFEADRVRLLADAQVGRDLRVARLDPERLQLAEGAQVGGRVVDDEVHLPDHEEIHDLLRPMFWVWAVVRVGAAFLFGVLVWLVAPSLFEGRVPDALSFLRALGIGFALLVAGPLALIVAALTLVGIPIAVLGAFAYVVALYLGVVAAAALIGRTAVGFGEPRSLGGFARALAIGLLVATVLVHVPWVGPAVRVVLLLVGLGLVFDRARALLYSSRAA